MYRWYVVNTYSGHENKVKSNLEHRATELGGEFSAAAAPEGGTEIMWRVPLDD